MGLAGVVLVSAVTLPEASSIVRQPERAVDARGQQTRVPPIGAQRRRNVVAVPETSPAPRRHPPAGVRVNRAAPPQSPRQYSWQPVIGHATGARCQWRPTASGAGGLAAARADAIQLQEAPSRPERQRRSRRPIRRPGRRAGEP